MKSQKGDICWLHVAVSHHFLPLHVAELIIWWLFRFMLSGILTKVVFIQVLQYKRKCGELENSMTEKTSAEETARKEVHVTNASLFSWSFKSMSKNIIRRNYAMINQGL